MYIAFTCENNGKYYSWAEKYTDSNNLLAVIKRAAGISQFNIVTANMYETKKKACEVVKLWNDGYKRDHKALFEISF